MSEKELSAEEIKKNTLPLLRHAEMIYVLSRRVYKDALCYLR